MTNDCDCSQGDAGLHCGVAVGIESWSEPVCDAINGAMAEDAPAVHEGRLNSIWAVGLEVPGAYSQSKSTGDSESDSITVLESSDPDSLSSEMIRIRINLYQQ